MIEKEIKNRDISLEVYKKIRYMIENNQIEADTKIIQKKLANELGVSCTPIINALRKLETESLIDYIPQTGFFLHKLNIKEFFELLNIKNAFDGIVAREIASKITDEQIFEIEAIWKPFEEKCRSKQYWEDPEVIENYKKADRLFHSTLYSWSNNEMLLRINNSFQINSRVFLGGLFRSPYITYFEHTEIVKSLKERDVIKAYEASINHNMNTINLLSDTINQLERLRINPTTLTLDRILKNPSIKN